MSSESQTKSDHAKSDHGYISRGSWIYISGLLLRLGARLPMLLIAGRAYGPALYGEYIICIGVVETLAAAATLGFKRTLFSFMQESNENEGSVGPAVRHALFIGIASACVLSLLLTLSAPFVATLLGIESGAYKLATLAWIAPVIVVTDLFLTATFFNRRLSYDIWSRCVAEPGAQVIVAGGLFALGAVTWGLTISYVAALVAAAATAAWGYSKQFGLRGLFGRIDTRRMWAMSNVSSRTALFDLFGILMSRLDMFVVGHFFSAGPVGLYAMAQQFITLPDKVGKSFVPVAMPVVSHAMTDGDLKRARAALASVAPRLAGLEGILVVSFIAGGSWLLELFGKGFGEAAMVLAILAIGTVVNDLLSLSSLPLVVARPSANPTASVATLIFYVGAVAMIGNSRGIEGIALISVLSALAGNLYRLWVCRQVLYPATATPPA